MLTSLLGAAIEFAINQALKLEPESAFMLGTLMDKSLGVEITDWNIRLVFYPKENGFTVLSAKPLTADVVLSGRLPDMATLAFSQSPQSILASGKVNLQGEVGALQAYQDFFVRLRLDWEGLLEKFLGPVASGSISSAVRKAVAHKKSMFTSASQDLEEYLHEEARCLPPRAEVEDFYQDIYALRADLDRLEARILKLKKFR